MGLGWAHGHAWQRSLQCQGCVEVNPWLSLCCRKDQTTYHGNISCKGNVKETINYKRNHFSVPVTVRKHGFFSLGIGAVTIRGAGRLGGLELQTFSASLLGAFSSLLLFCKDALHLRLTASSDAYFSVLLCLQPSLQQSLWYGFFLWLIFSI